MARYNPSVAAYGGARAKAPTYPRKTTANERMAESGSHQIGTGSTGSSGYASAPPPVIPKRQVQAQPPVTYGGGGGGGGGYGDLGGGGAALMSAPAPAFDPNVEYLKEAGFLATASALDKALQDFNNQDTAERGRYDLDYDKGLRDLGFRDNTADITTDNLDDLNTKDVDESLNGRAWDWNDMLTASGRGYQTNTNDFASRGMLQSQGYLDSLKLLERSLEDQRGAMGTARQNFSGERDVAKTNYVNQDAAARNAAKVSAIERLNAQLGLI